MSGYTRTVHGAELDNAIGSGDTSLIYEETSTQKVEEIGSSETSLIFYRATNHHNPEEGKYIL